MRILVGVGFEHPLVLAGLLLLAVPVVLWFLSSRRLESLARFFEIVGSFSKERWGFFVVDVLLLSMIVLSASVPYLRYRERRAVSFEEARLLAGKRVLVLFLVDVSKSMNYPLGASTRIEAAKDAMRRVIEALGENTSIMIVVFSGRVRQVFYGETERALASVENITAGERYTAIGDALSYALSAARVSGIPAAVILVSDGKNNYGSDPEAVARMYRQTGTPLIVLAVGGRGVLPRVAEASGGRIYDLNEFTTPSLGDLVGDIARTARYAALKARGEAYVEDEVRDYSLFYLVSLAALALFFYTCLNEW